MLKEPEGSPRAERLSSGSRAPPQDAEARATCPATMPDVGAGGNGNHLDPARLQTILPGGGKIVAAARSRRRAITS